MPYATRDSVFLLALSAQAFVTRPRPLEGPGGAPYGANEFNPATGVIRLVGNGFATTDLVYLTVTTGGTLPGGAAALTYYHPLPLGGDLLQLSATSGGAPLTFTSPGTGWSIAVDPMRRLDAHLVETAAEIDEHLTAHEPPIQPDPVTGLYPPVLVGLNARMAARAAVTSLQIENAAYKVARDRLDAKEAQDLVLLQDWKNGKPVQPRPTDKNSIPDNAARASACRPVPWLTGRI